MASQTLLCSEVSPIDPGVVCELSRPSDARVERLAALPTRFLPIPPVRVEEIATTIGEERNPFIRSGRGSTQQALGFEVLQALASRCAALDARSMSLSDTTRKAPTVASTRPSVPLTS